MKILRIALIAVFIALIVSCKKDNPDESETEAPTELDSFDLGIRFSHYESGKIYENDTIRNEFIITNYGSVKLRKGDKIQTACRIDGVLFALDLIGEGPTAIELKEDLGINESLTFNPGYLLGSSMLAYFATDTLDICIMIYGVNGTFDTGFSKDTRPENNTACLQFSTNAIQLK